MALGRLGPGGSSRKYGFSGKNFSRLASHLWQKRSRNRRKQKVSRNRWNNKKFPETGEFLNTIRFPCSGAITKCQPAKRVWLKNVTDAGPSTTFKMFRYKDTFFIASSWWGNVAQMLDKEENFCLPSISPFYKLLSWYHHRHIIIMISLSLLSMTFLAKRGLQLFKLPIYNS